MLSDPQSITVSGSAKSMPRTSVGDQTAHYANSDDTFQLDVVHRASGKDRVQHIVTFKQQKVVPDPLTAVNDYDNCSIRISIDRPLAGWTSTELDALWSGLKTWADSTLIGKLYGKES